VKNTRALIIQANFDAIQKYGFHQLRPDKVVEKLGISKGAFYHYFSGKENLLEVIIDEMVIPNHLKTWSKLDKQNTDAISSIQQILQLQADQLSSADVRNGCVVDKLIHEICQEYPILRQKMRKCSDQIIDMLTHTIQIGLDLNKIKPLLDANHLAYLILTVYQGSKTLSKVEDSVIAHKKSIKACILILETLRNK